MLEIMWIFSGKGTYNICLMWNISKHCYHTRPGGDQNIVIKPCKYYISSTRVDEIEHTENCRKSVTGHTERWG